MTDYSAIIEELSNLNPPQKSFDNKLILQALETIGNPQFSYKVIHIAGTNGKGSTAAFIEAGLTEASYKVGKFSSPFIHIINECICVNGIMISDNELANLYTEHKTILENKNIFLSSFEMLTLLMFVHCKNQQIDYLVLETGLGGRDDSTNVVDSQYSIITNISLEHTQFLGNNLSDIAKHKAGIIKNGLTVVGDNLPELIEAVKDHSNNYISIKDYYKIKNIKLDKDNFTTKLEFTDNINRYNFILGLFGYFQAYNFLCAFTVLRDIGLSIEQIASAAHKVKWHGRLQKIRDNPLIIADASHNVDGVTNLANSLTEWFDHKNSVIICSILNDKDIVQMLDQYSKISQNIIFCSIPDQPRTSNAHELADLARGKFAYIDFTNTPQEAMKRALQMNVRHILISGSCYLLKYFI